MIVLFLDVDGVLLPFGCANQDGGKDDEDTRHSCSGVGIFPEETMDALEFLLQQATRLKKTTTTTTMGRSSTGTFSPLSSSPLPVNLVLSSTWRAQPAFVQTILDSFHAYHGDMGRDNNDNSNNCTTQDTLLSHVMEFYDTTDPMLHTERQHEIYAWLQLQKNQKTKDNACFISAWVALDDEDLLLGAANAKHRHVFEGHCVQTDSHVGLTMDNAREALQLLQKQLLSAT